MPTVSALYVGGVVENRRLRCRQVICLNLALSLVKNRLLAALTYCLFITLV
ncbi:MAG: hypothetical protein OFPII_26930 [Osedax symbiont Rs1]|nr:MAG: hypothetical protein OFPII_26930 [Osedax symbiont Rs1]